jgi:hypothetical protein
MTPSGDVDIGWPRHQLEEAPPSFEDRGRACKAGACQHGGENRIAAGFGIGQTLPVGQVLRPVGRVDE